MSMLVPTHRNLWVPWPSFRDLEDRLDRIFRGFPSGETSWAPAVDVSETDDAYVIEADLPGLKKEDIELTVEDEVVTVKGTRNSARHCAPSARHCAPSARHCAPNETEDKPTGYHRIERGYGEFRRSFCIPGGVDADKVQANFTDGVLHVTLPKPEQRKPKQIEVKVK